MIKTCLNCEKEFEAAANRAKFCNHSCSASYNNRGFNRHYTKRPDCVVCGNKINIGNMKYCSHKCAMTKRITAQNIVENWKNGLDNGVTGGIALKPAIKKYIWDKYKAQCAKCGWNTPHPVSGKPPLEVDHINGDWQDNREENLILLCPNCHALTLTYRSRNNGHGRHTVLKDRGLVVYGK